LKFGRAELTSAQRGDWTGLNFAYAVIIKKLLPTPLPTSK